MTIRSFKCAAVRGARAFLVLAAVATGLAPHAAAAAEAPRYALVIGNAHYSTSPLTNPINDARQVAAMLRQDLHFSNVTVLEDADDTKIKRTLSDFGEQLARNGAIGFFYYSGHGVSVDGHNYMLPIGRRFADEADVRLFGVDVDQVLALMKDAGNPLNIVVLDACRDFPLRRRAKGVSKGLARVTTPLPGSLIAFATRAGETADDNPQESNGLFTKYLLRRLPQPGRRLDDAFQAVSWDVAEASGRRQIPELLTTLLDPDRPFYLASAGQAASAVAGGTDAAQHPPQQHPASPVPSTAALRHYRADVFYCQGPEELALKAQAQALASRLRNVVRGTSVRPLSETKNADPGYRIQGNEVRYEVQELDLAKQLAAELRVAGGPALGLRQVANSTPNYLSVFLCSAAPHP